MANIKTLNVKVVLEIRADPDDDDSVREAIKEGLAEAIEDDSLDYTAEEEEE